jgi:glucose-6-phosphate 1-dehydrogenase
MKALHPDAIVFFGATGDLAYKKIFPSLQAMVKRGSLAIPVIGVAKAGWKIVSWTLSPAKCIPNSLKCAGVRIVPST